MWKNVHSEKKNLPSSLSMIRKYKITKRRDYTWHACFHCSFHPGWTERDHPITLSPSSCRLAWGEDLLIFLSHHLIRTSAHKWASVSCFDFLTRRQVTLLLKRDREGLQIIYVVSGFTGSHSCPSEFLLFSSSHFLLRNPPHDIPPKLDWEWERFFSTH